MGISILSSTDPNDMALAIAMALPIRMYFLRSRPSYKVVLYRPCPCLHSGDTLFRLARRLSRLLIGASVFFMVWTKKLRLAGFASRPHGASVHTRRLPGEVQFDLRCRDYAYSAGRLGMEEGARNRHKGASGVGISNYALTEGDRRKEKGYTGKWNVAHNSYLQVAVELGIAGFVLYCLFPTTDSRISEDNRCRTRQ